MPGRYGQGITLGGVGPDPQAWGVAMNAHPFGNHQSGAFSAANRTTYMRVIGAQAGVTKVRYQVVSASGNIAWAVYANSGVGDAARPAGRLATTGSFACPGANIIETALGATLNISHGDFWLAFASDNVTATFIIAASVNQTTPHYSWCAYESAYPPPSTAAPVASSGALARVPVAQLIP